jgi:hypothetical protein
MNKPEKFCDNPHCICHVEMVAGCGYRMVKDANGEFRTVQRSNQSGKAVCSLCIKTVDWYEQNVNKNRVPGE